MSLLGFGKKSDFYIKIASLGPLLVRFLVEIWSDKSLILRFLGLIFCLVALKLVPTGSNWFNLDQYGSYWFKLVKYGSIWFNMFQTGGTQLV